MFRFTGGPAIFASYLLVLYAIDYFSHNIPDADWFWLEMRSGMEHRSRDFFSEQIQSTNSTFTPPLPLKYWNSLNFFEIKSN